MTEPAPPSRRLSILVPTFNEADTIREVVQRLLDTPFPLEYELILIDDHSSDDTLAIERALRDRQDESRRRRPGRGPARLVVLHNRVNKGKGACIRQGLKHATGDLVVVQDGDLEYHPGELLKLLPPFLEGRDLVMVGSRFGARRWPQGMGLLSLLANRTLTWLTNVLYGLRLSDMECCYKIIPTAHMRRARIHSDRFEVDPELVAKLARAGVPFDERPIAYEGRSYAEGKKIRAKDFFLAAWALIYWRVARLPAGAARRGGGVLSPRPEEQLGPRGSAQQ